MPTTKPPNTAEGIWNNANTPFVVPPEIVHEHVNAGGEVPTWVHDVGKNRAGYRVRDVARGPGKRVDPPVWVTTSVPGTVCDGSAYSFQFLASGVTPLTFTIMTGALPAGLTMTSGGLITGAVVLYIPGDYPFTCKVSNVNGSDTKLFVLTVYDFS